MGMPCEQAAWMRKFSALSLIALSENAMPASNMCGRATAVACSLWRLLLLSPKCCSLADDDVSNDFGGGRWERCSAEDAVVRVNTNIIAA